MILIELYLLLLFMVLAALVAVESHNLVSSVISVGAVGLGLCLVFLLLNAPELALTQLVVEILALIILIRATVSVSVPETYKGRELLAYTITVLFIIVFIAVVHSAARTFHGFGLPASQVASQYLTQTLAKTGASNVVAGVALDYRALDMVGALAGLFAAVIGVLTIMRPRGRREN